MVSLVLWSGVDHSCFSDVVGVIVVFNDRFRGSFFFFFFFLLGAASVTPMILMSCSFLVSRDRLLLVLLLMFNRYFNGVDGFDTPVFLSSLL
jgi:hypothetical protein